MSDQAYAKQLSESDKLNICSVGTGTGGDLLGLILAIAKRIEPLPPLQVVSIEGNSAAHGVAKRIISAASEKLNISLDANFIDHEFVAPDPFSVVGDILPAHSCPFHFVVNSKMLNELDKREISPNPYFEFVDAFCNVLDQLGTILILDITSKNGAGETWTPYALNGQINEYLAQHESKKTLFPLLCNRFESDCGSSERCYTQNKIFVSYKSIENECSKICYRLIGNSTLVDSLCNLPTLWNCPITKNNKNHCGVFNA